MDRFWDKVEEAVERDGCWTWLGFKNKKGYGMFWLKGSMRYAHRVAWTLERGPIPADLQVCHHCDNPPCVRPDHLFLGTAKANVHDSMKKGRCLRARGERVAGSKLSGFEVLEIRKKYRPGLGPKLAAEFGINRMTVTQIIRRDTWKHI